MLNLKQNGINIVDCGAIGDGNHMNTEAIQTAIHLCCERGGGKVIIPPGIFMTGTIMLRSNITLQLENGAILRGSSSIEDYVYNGYYHNEFKEALSLIYAIDQKSIRITGEGCIDLSGKQFMNFDVARNAEAYVEQLNSTQKEETACGYITRPEQPIFFHACENIMIDTITVLDSPCWAITFSDCKQIRIHSMNIDNHLRVPNSDGIHLCSCQNVIIADCIFSCGDDCIAITGITCWDKPSENISISNCIMRSRSSALRLGHEASKVKNITVNNLNIYESNRGLAIFAGDEGWVTDVKISNIVMHTGLYAGNWWGKGEPLVISAADSNGRIERVSVTGVQARSENGIVMMGCKYNIRNIQLADWSLHLNYGLNRNLIGGIIDLQPAPVRTISKHDIPWIYAEGAYGVTLKDFYITKEENNGFAFDTSPYMKNIDHLSLQNNIQVIFTQ